MYIKKPYDPGYSVIPPNYRGTAFDNIDLPPCPPEPPCPPKQECDCCGPLPKHDCPPHRKGCFNILPAFSSLFKNRDMLILAGLLFLLMQNNSADCKPDGTLLLLALVLLL